MAFLPSLGFLGFEIHIFYCNTPCLVWLPIQHRRKPISREPDFSVQKQGFLDGFLGEHVATDISFFSPVLFALARNGTLAFVPGRDASKRHLVWVDRTGHAEPLKSLPQRAYAAPRLAPDAQRIMTLFEDTGDLWIFDMRGSSIRLTKDGLSVRAVWSADSSQVAYSSARVNRAEPGPA